jgi:hypothetical protein
MNAKKFASHLAAVPLVLLAGCMSPPAGLDLSPQRLSANNTYIVETHPANGLAPINKIHSWEVRVTLPSGQPVDGARIAVDGGMPQHGHGLPTQPKVTRELGNGRYLMEGMKFSMTGWWEIKLKIDGAQGSDKVTFNTIVTGKSARQDAGQDQLARR